MGQYGFSIEFENEHCCEFINYYGRLPKDSREFANFVLFGFKPLA